MVANYKALLTAKQGVNMTRIKNHVRAPWNRPTNLTPRLVKHTK